MKDRLRETIKTPTDAVNALRSGVKPVFQGVFHRDILVWIVRVSPRLLPDIVRPSLVLEEEMAGFMFTEGEFWSIRSSAIEVYGISVEAV